MKEDVFNTSVRKLLKEFGVTAQREIERAVHQAVAERRLEEARDCPTTLTLSIPTVGLTHTTQRATSILVECNNSLHPQ